MQIGPSLSIAIPNFNHARFLPEQLEAILTQSYVPLEVIVLDDASTDNSVEVVESFARRYPIVRLVRNERNMGAGQNTNRLFRMAKGDYVFLPSADDQILPGFFEKSMSLLAQYPQAGLCSATGYLIGEDGSRRSLRAYPIVARKAKYLTPEEVRGRLCKYGRWFEATSVIYRREALLSEGGYRDEIGSFADSFANLVISLRHGACYIPEPLTCWRQMASGYGSQMPGGWQGMLKRGACITDLLRGEYGNVFPPMYVDIFERHWKYMAAVAVRRYAMLDLTQTLQGNLSQLYSNQLLLHRVFLKFMRLCVKVQSTMWYLYFAARFGPFGWWFRGRLSILLHLKKFVIWERLHT